MTFKEAYAYAMEHSAQFRKHDENVKDHQKNGTTSSCLIFSVEPGETFYYGFDGVEMQKGRHTRRRAATLLNRRDAVLIIL